MTITQTVEIPANSRSITLEIPREIPSGRTIIAFTPANTAKQDGTTARPSEKLEAAASRKTPRADRLLGAAADLGDISLDEIRDERLAKHLV